MQIADHVNAGAVFVSAVMGLVGGGAGAVIFIQSQVRQAVEPLAKEFRDFKDNWPSQLNGRYMLREVAEEKFRSSNERIDRLEEEAG